MPRESSRKDSGARVGILVFFSALAAIFCLAAFHPGWGSPSPPVAISADPAPRPEAAPAHAPPADPSSLLRIVKPKASEIVSGTQEIVVLAPLSAGPAAIEVSVDGKPLGRIENPPYSINFDFGQTLASRTIVARIVTGPSAGSTAEVRTRGFDMKTVGDVARIDLVTLYASVRGPGGRFITNLPRDAFTVYDGTARQNLVHFGLERRPLVAAIVLDVSFSMRGEPIAAAREAAIRFTRSLAPEDRAMVIAFSDDPRIVTDLTNDRGRLASAIHSIDAKGGTALYDAIYMAADRLSREDGRKVIVLLSDGRDESQSGIEPGSLHTFEEALEKALRSEAILFTIGFGKQVDKEMDFYGRTPLKEILSRLATDSGGTFQYPQRASQLNSTYDLIGEELRNQYSLAYSPEPLRADGAWHPIRVELKEPSLKVLTRRGYYAPKS
jgi:Ca-activated chloride channel family protein